MSELSWLKRLASALVRDEADANDLVQETWLVAAEHAPTDGRPLKPWLSRVALNLVRMRSRASKRRTLEKPQSNLRRRARRHLTSSWAVCRAQRIVADEVLRLAEPYRNTVLLHYFEDLSSAEIARRSGVPEGTVRRRLKVALDECAAAFMRKSGRRAGGRRRPRTPRRQQTAASAGSAALGVVLVKKAIALVVVAVGLLVLGARLYRHHARTAMRPPPPDGRSDPRGSIAVATDDTALAHIVVSVADDAAAHRERDRAVRAGGWRCRRGQDSESMATRRSMSRPGNGRSPHRPLDTNLPRPSPRRRAAREDHVQPGTRDRWTSVTGTVTDTSGGAIAGVRIDAAQLDLNATARAPWPPRSAMPQANTSSPSAAGRIVVAASHPEYAPQTRYVGRRHGRSDSRLRARARRCDRGRGPRHPNKAARHRAPRSARVAIRRARARQSDRTRRQGRRSRQVPIRGTAPRRVRDIAREGARDSHAPVGSGSASQSSRQIVVLVVAGTATIRGKVVDDSGAPVRCDRDAFGGGRGRRQGHLRLAGAFVLEGLAPGRWALRGTGQWTPPMDGPIVELAKSDVDGIVVRVRRGFEVKGHVEPRKLCDVEISKDERGESCRTRLDDDESRRCVSLSSLRSRGKQHHSRDARMANRTIAIAVRKAPANVAPGQADAVDRRPGRRQRWQAGRRGHGHRRSGNEMT